MDLNPFTLPDLTMKNSFYRIMPLLAALLMLPVSCTKEPVLGDIQATIDGYTVTFSITASHVDSWLWDFGDGQTSTDEAPVHDYAQSGTYTVTVTATGKGGEQQASKQITIQPSVTEMLSGGPEAADGKTWVLSSGYIEGVDGGGAVDSALTIVLPSVEDMLTQIGLGYEYDNEYTFYGDGRYKVDVKNGIALTTGLYGSVIGNIVDYGNEANNLNIYGGSYTPPDNATWTLHTEDLVVDAISNPLGTDVPAPHADVTIHGRKWVSLSEGAFFGILDFPTTRKFIIKEITPDRLSVALFICGYFLDPNAWSIPTYLIHVTFVPKQ
jgi:PKD repeat protein